MAGILESADVARVCILGISSPKIIAKESGLPVERVQKILEPHSGGYGTSSYGKAPYGGNRKSATAAMYGLRS